MRLTDGDGVEDDEVKEEVVVGVIFIVFIHGGRVEDGIVAAEPFIGSVIATEPRERTGGGSGRERLGMMAGGNGRDWNAKSLGCTYFSAKVSKMWSYLPA